MRQRAVLVGCVLAALLTAAGLFVTDYGIDPDLWLVAVAAGFLLLLAALDPWVHRRRAAGLSTGDQLAAAARDLVVALKAQWIEESRSRGLDDAPLDLHWSSPDGSAPPGRGDAVVGAFERQPDHRLVLLGEPGAGKSTTALMLTLGLLDRHTAGPVPILLPLSTWDPDVEDVRTWLTRRLYEDHPALRNTELYGSYAAELLVEQRLVLPILDGFDQVARHPGALERINRAFPPSTPLVLTSRTDGFAGCHVPGAGVVELHPLDHEEIAGYLRAHADPVIAARWEPIFLHLRAEPDDRLADALSTPLAVWLAGTVYADGEPSELLDRARFPDRASVEDHLVDMLVTTAFGDRAVAHHARASQVWSRADAHRWLTFLARELHGRGVRELAWWELRRSVGRQWLAVLGALVLGTIGGFGVAWLMAYASTPKLAPITGLAAGIAVAVAALRASGRRSPKPKPGIWRSLVVVSGVLGLAVGLVFGALYGPSAGLVVGLGLAVASALRFALADNAELTHPSSPKWTMARDRIAVLTGSLVLSVTFGTAGGLVFGAHQSGMVGLGLACGLLLGFALSVLHLRWWWFTVARVWLALRRKVPWELMVFLDDARKLGVLRQSGACYQFRHALVQDRLAGPRTSAGQPA
ncbi:energy-coupling factor transporter ATP-binding protein EcfA2 [Saccharothrix violaceirubra]|uniref:Energy-coupling factor transporter ATP-binding protein EcfA2 n=1 Tax=Saccharothrix violaceirubra TaxID=413306 RepID=A0A7W7WTH6_9PSEU|nr:energy-coupling factor transporter ATP-binding protein EcfA2 [Saccharothrix violaceirubra]